MANFIYLTPVLNLGHDAVRVSIPIICEANHVVLLQSLVVAMVLLEIVPFEASLNQVDFESLKRKCDQYHYAGLDTFKLSALLIIY